METMDATIITSAFAIFSIRPIKPDSFNPDSFNKDRLTKIHEGPTRQRPVTDDTYYLLHLGGRRTLLNLMPFPTSKHLRDPSVDLLSTSWCCMASGPRLGPPQPLDRLPRSR